MKLTYRGIGYKSQKQEVKPEQLDNSILLNKHLKCDKHNPQPTNRSQENKVILVRPIHYYTYRGVSYTKNLIFDTHTKLLLNVDRS